MLPISRNYGLELEMLDQGNRVLGAIIRILVGIAIRIFTRIPVRARTSKIRAPHLKFGRVGNAHVQQKERSPYPRYEHCVNAVTIGYANSTL